MKLREHYHLLQLKRLWLYFVCDRTRGTCMLQEPDAYNEWNVGSLAGRVTGTHGRTGHGGAGWWVANAAAVPNLFHMQTTL